MVDVTDEAAQLPGAGVGLQSCPSEASRAPARAPAGFLAAGLDQKRGAVFGGKAASDPTRGHFEKVPREEMRRSEFNSMRSRASRSPSHEEFNHVQEYLRTEIYKSKMECMLTITDKEVHNQAEFHAFREHALAYESANDKAIAQMNSDLRSYTTTCCMHLHEEINRLAFTLGETMRQGFAVAQEQRQQLHDTELAARTETRRDMSQYRAELSSAIAVQKSEFSVLLKALEAASVRSLEALRSSVSETHERDHRSVTEDLTRLQTEQATFTGDMVRRMEGLEADTKAGIDHTANVLLGRVTAFEGEQSASSVDTSRQFHELRTDTDRRLAWMEQQARSLARSVNEVESIPTRRVEWLVEDASFRLCGALGGEAGGTGASSESASSWFSPKFEAAGARGLQLELRRLDPCEDGDAALCLWASDTGLNLICRLFIGVETVQVQHTFDGVAPLRTSYICHIRDQISPDNDSLCIGVEILEAVREVRNQPRPPSAGDTRNDSEVKRACTLNGPIVSHRHLNHCMMDHMRKQVELMRSRMVRCIEWKLEQASALRRCFPEGESLCSTNFDSAGVEGLQLVFYPSGYHGVREGFCSLFVHCPGGCKMRCWLSAGKQRREVHQACEQQPGFLGRTNFCRFEACVDAVHDTVMVVLEVEEAQQSETESMSHQLATMPDARASHAGTPGPGCKSPLPVDHIDSTLKLRREPGKAALDEVKQLPSIWTPRMPEGIAQALEGFHTFAELAKPPQGPRRPLGNGRRPHSSLGNVSGGEGAPPATPLKYKMYARA